MPAGLTFEQAATVPQAGVLALQGLSYRGAIGEEVLINGAGGGVGTFAVQMAKASGAMPRGDSARVAARLPASFRGEPGKLALRYDPASVHWFDAESGRRIEA